MVLPSIREEDPIGITVKRGILEGILAGRDGCVDRDLHGYILTRDPHAWCKLHCSIAALVALAYDSPSVALEEPELRAMFNDFATASGTHRPVLCEAIVRTTGPILELGMGDNSTPPLHEVAEAHGRRVCSYDHDASWVARYSELLSANHQIEHVASWDDCPIESARWGIVLVDHSPNERRIVDIGRLAEHADVIVVHDTQDGTFGYEAAFSSFKYRLDYRDDPPWTTLLSNYVDVSSWSIRAEGLVADGQQKKLTTSVLVPCAGAHVARLPELIAALRSQTRPPDEIIVAVSGCKVSDLKRLDVDLVYSANQFSAGANRNRAGAVARGDIFIYQDADDLPHPQRVEIIATLFEGYAIDHLMHYFYYREGSPSQFSLKEAATRSEYYGELMREARYRTGLVEYVTNGNVAVSRALARAVPWPEHFKVGEDQQFNRAVYARTKRTVVTPLPLITYRQKFSTFRRTRRQRG